MFFQQTFEIVTVGEKTGVANNISYGSILFVSQ